VAKSPTDHIRDLTAQVRVLEDRDATRRAELEELKSVVRREREERKGADEKHQNEIAELRRELAETRQEAAVLKQQLQDHVKHTELSDARRWAFVLAFVSALLALASGLIITLARK
jgi:predicted RNase H-like nuclease (RuvC/YqgF family)